MPSRGYRPRLCQMSNALAEPERAPELVTTSLVGLAVIFTATGYVCNFAYQDPANPITVSLIDEFGISGLPAAANWLVVISVALKFPMQFFPMAQQLEHALEIDRYVCKRDDEGISKVTAFGANIHRRARWRPVVRGLPGHVGRAGGVDSSSGQ